MTSAVSYRMRRWYDQWAIFVHFQGSVLPRTLLAVSLSTILCYVYWELALDKGHAPRGVELMGNPAIYGFFMQTSGVLLAFTTTICYNRFWESLSLLVTWSQGLAYISSMVLCFESDRQFLSAETFKWQAKMIHCLTILHAVGIEQLYSAEGQNGAALEVLGGFTSEERNQLEVATDQPTAVVHWLNQNLAGRIFEGGLDMAAPITAQIWSVLGSSMNSYANAIKYAKNRVPLSFQQCLAATDIIMLLFTPLAVAAFVPHLALALLLNFICSFIYHSIYLADTSMQQPFGDKARDLPLIQVHRNFINKVLTMMTYEVALELHELYEKAAKFTAIHPNRKAFCAVCIDNAVKKTGQISTSPQSGAGKTEAPSPESCSCDAEEPGAELARIPIKSPLRNRRDIRKSPDPLNVDSPSEIFTTQRLQTLRSQDPRRPSSSILMMKSESHDLKPFGKEVHLPVQAHSSI